MRKRPDTPPKTAAKARDERLKAALKANMAKRKAQLRRRQSAGKRADGPEE